MDRDEEEIREEHEQRLINEEYKMWKKNNPFLYDLVISHALEWPSLTVQWLPDYKEMSGGDYALQSLLMGTHTSDNEQNYLTLVQVKLPGDGFVNPDARSGSGSGSGWFEFGFGGPKVQVIQQINHQGEVNRARYMPQKSNIIATKTVSGEVHLFDYIKHPAKPHPGGECNPELRLRGHMSEGYGLSWNVLQEGYLLSGSDDAQVCVWDVNAVPSNKTLDALRTFTSHEGVVEDVAWNQKNDYQFGSAGDDRYLHIWDLRVSGNMKPVQSVIAHDSEVNCLSFNPFNEMLVATGSTDNTVKLFDLRKLTNATHTMDSHNDEIFQVGWSPKHEQVLASCCLGRRVLVWDLSRVNQEQTPEEALEGPPELLFIHGGHTSKVSDFSWNMCEEWVIASVAEDNIVQIWQMSDHIYLDKDDLP